MRLTYSTRTVGGSSRTRSRRIMRVVKNGRMSGEKRAVDVE